MLKHLDETYRVLNTFCQTSGIGAICFDTQLNIIGSRPTKTVVNDFICLGTGSVTRFLAETFDRKPDNINNCYTYLLEGNLVCVISFVMSNDSYIGAFVTQPVFIKTNSLQETKALIEKLCPTESDQKTLKAIVKRVPFRNFEKLAYIGETLSSIMHRIFGGNRVVQIVCGETGKIVESENNSDEHKSNVDDMFPVRQLRFTDYLSLKEGIQSGDTTAIEDVANKISNGSMPTHQLDSKNYLRSLKDSYIKLSAMACFAAIEANAPYYKMLDLTDEHIRQVETIESALEIFELMKKTLFTFTRSVKINKIQTYSKAVRQVLDHIDAHYDEKITLEILSEHTGLSTFYLSSLIKKETGLILLDNINAVRIEKSKALLLKSSLRMIDISHQVGFSSQNHFSTVFKKYTGMTPSEYVRVMSGGIEPKDAKLRGNRTVKILAEHMQKTLSLLPEMYDVAQIVDPKNNTSWTLKNYTEETLAEACYEFLGRGTRCDNCISQKAFINNHAYYKLDRKGDGMVLVIAIPKTIGKETYVLELLKTVNGELLVESDKESLDSQLIEQSSISGKLDTFCDRKEIEERLPFYVRHSRLENKPFSVILSMLEDYSDESGFSATDLQQTIITRHANEQATRLIADSCLAGYYTGDILLLALGDTDYAEACKVAATIENDFENMAFNLDGRAKFFNVYSGIKTLTPDIADANELISLALIDLNTKIKGGLATGDSV